MEDKLKILVLTKVVNEMATMMHFAYPIIEDDEPEEHKRISDEMYESLPKWGEELRAIGVEIDVMKHYHTSECVGTSKGKFDKLVYETILEKVTDDYMSAVGAESFSYSVRFDVTKEDGKVYTDADLVEDEC